MVATVASMEPVRENMNSDKNLPFAGLIVWNNKQLLYTVSTEVVVDCPMKFR